jgi:beta-glucosidase-like glycosyl hydrolase
MVGRSFTWCNVYNKKKDGVSEPTSFPISLSLAASFNLDLIHHIAEIISTEAHADNNEQIIGLNFYTPNVNIFRDLRWGRGQETPGEYPFVASQYA